jgi:hypothetical protein
MVMAGSLFYCSQGHAAGIGMEGIFLSSEKAHAEHVEYYMI